MIQNCFKYNLFLVNTVKTVKRGSSEIGTPSQIGTIGLVSLALCHSYMTLWNGDTSEIGTLWLGPMGVPISKVLPRIRMGNSVKNLAINVTSFSSKNRLPVRHGGRHLGHRGRHLGHRGCHLGPRGPPSWPPFFSCVTLCDVNLWCFLVDNGGKTHCVILRWLSTLIFRSLEFNCIFLWCKRSKQQTKIVCILSF